MTFETMFDLMTDEALQAHVLDWARHQGKRPPPPSLDEYMACVIPRSVFFKNLHYQSVVLDIGAGDGSIAVFRDWPLFLRKDIKLYALDVKKGEMFDRYDGYEIVDFEATLPVFSGITFDALLCAHFLEHITDPARCIRWMGSVLPPGGRVYLEWPHAISKRMPHRLEIAKRGLPVLTTNFADDATHIDTYDMSRICELVLAAGLRIESSGRIMLPWLAEQLKISAHLTGNVIHGTLAVWFHVGWSQYLVAVKA